jgi:hypothetical protein
VLTDGVEKCEATGFVIKDIDKKQGMKVPPPSISIPKFNLAKTLSDLLVPMSIKKTYYSINQQIFFERFHF